MGKPTQAVEVPLTEDDQMLRKEVMQNVVLIEWGKRCGKECAQKWNETVGKVVDLKIPLDKL